ncbi:MAG TPA: hypothetical protein ENF87_02095 [Thermoproteales archaeon]|nr:hypothetical protein [Thermoproteales archaeon]
MKFTTFELELESKIPKKIKVSIRTEVYMVSKNGSPLKINPLTTRDFKPSDALIFDRKFSESILLSYSDLVSGNHSVKVIEYDLPENILRIAELFEVEDFILGEKRYLVNVYSVEEKGVTKEDTMVFKKKTDALRLIRSIHIGE